MPMMFVHGFGSSHNQWTRNLAPLSQSHPVYALDLLGFGASQKAATSYNVALWAEQIYEFWKTFIGRPMLLIGHSLGALVAATAASQFPDAIAGVVMMTLPATRQERLANPWIQKTLGAIEKSVANPLTIRLIFQVARQRWLIQTALKAAYVSSAYITETLVDDVVNPTRDRGAAQTLCRLTQAVTTPNYSQSRETLLASIQQPTLILWGTGDRIIPIQQSYSLREEFPAIQWIDIPNAGHCLYDECSETVNELIIRWATEQFTPITPS